VSAREAAVIQQPLGGIRTCHTDTPSPKAHKDKEVAVRTTYRGTTSISRARYRSPELSILDHVRIQSQALGALDSAVSSLLLLQPRLAHWARAWHHCRHTRAFNWYHFEDRSVQGRLRRVQGLSDTRGQCMITQ